MSKLLTLSDFYRQVGVKNPPTEANLIILPYPPFQSQVSGLKAMLRYDRFGLYDDAGTGKSFPLQAYATLFALYGNRVVIVMPPNLIGQFIETWHEFMVDVDKYLTIRDYRGTARVREAMWNRWDETRWPDILLMSYQMFSSLHRLRPKKDRKSSRQKKDGTPVILKGWKKDKQHRLKPKGYNVLLMDESQAVKRISSDITKVTRRFVDNGDNNLVLSTGSPAGNTPEDCYAPIKLITPDVYETKAQFERMHIERNPYSPFKEIVGFKNLDLLNKNLYLQARRVTKQEVNKDLPEVIYSKVPVDLGRAHMALYRKLLKTRILEFDGKILDATNASKLRMTALQLISNPENYVDKGTDIHNAMDETLDEIIDSIGPKQHKIIIFSNFKATVRRLADRYASLNPAVINSQTRDANEERIKFRSDESCRMIICNYESGGVGLNLQNASHLVMFEPTTVPKQFHQAMARAVRAGQAAEYVNAYLLAPKKTWAWKQIDQLLDKDEVVQEVVRDPVKILKELINE